ncbi:fungal-specific transcription factor domain-containing protein [Aspergillus multicolor]|uniref:transcription factor domain-containing protein n=1 Tax=Aspergillus multicolor TaxID=41759 RepID=UPI003CCE1039
MSGDPSFQAGFHLWKHKEELENQLERKKLIIEEILERNKEEKNAHSRTREEIQSLEQAIAKERRVIEAQKEVIEKIKSQAESWKSKYLGEKDHVASAQSKIVGLQGEITSRESTINDMKSAGTQLRERLTASRDRIKDLQIECSNSNRLLAEANTRLSELEGFATGFSELDEEHLINEYASLWDYARTEIHSQLEMDLDNKVLRDRSAWEGLRNCSLALQHRVPLPSSNSLAAKQMRLAVILAILAREIDKYIFQPTYIAGKDCLIRPLLADLAAINTEKEAFCRSILFSLDSESQSKSCQWRVWRIVKNVSSYICPLLSDEQTSQFCQSLEKIVQKAVEIWHPIQHARRKYESSFEPAESDDESAAFVFPGLESVQPPSNVKPQLQHSLIIFPHIYGIEGNKKILFTPTWLLRNTDPRWAVAEQEMEQGPPHSTIERVMPDTKEKPFGCDKCTKSFTRKDLLVRHERLTHSSSPAASTPGSVPAASTQPVFDGLNVLASAVTDHPFPSTGEPVLPASHVAFPTAPAPEPAPFSEPFPYEGDDFTSFLDSIPLPSHPYSPTYQPLPLFPPLQFDSGSEYPSTIGHDGGAATPSRPVLPRHGTQLPSLQLEESQPPTRTRPPKVPIVVTTQCRDRLVRELRDYANVIPEQSIPSRHALSRCLTGYLTGYHDHYPFLHIPTLNIETTPLHLVLSMAALGAQYCREHDTSIGLFQVAKAVTMEHMRREFQWNGLHDHQTKQASSVDQSQDILETIQSLLMLMSVSSWFEHYPPHYEGLFIRSPMETLMRKYGLNSLPRQDGSWESWIRKESAKRTKLIVFCFLGIQTIVFDVPPNILTEEIKLDLPCAENEWTAASASEWMQCRQYGRGSPRLQDALNSLFTRTPNAGGELESFTSLGGYALIHAIIQIIWLIQKACRVPACSSSSLSPAQITSLEHALENWCQCWERNQESSTDPFNPNGPISFTSTALLRMAYIRLNADFSSARRLQTFNPDEIARSLRQNLTVQRSDRLTRAALHCAHALSTPIKLGINYVARTLVVSWSNQYALCSLECAVLLAKWLEIATVPNPEPRLTEQETKLLEFVIEMVMEAQHGVSRSWLLANNTRLSAVVTRLWARLFTADYIYELVNLIGRSLNRYADLLEGVEAA